MMEEFIKTFNQILSHARIRKAISYWSHSSSTKPANLPATVLADNEFEWISTTKQQDPLIPAAKPHIGAQGTKYQRQFRTILAEDLLKNTPKYGPDYGTPTNNISNRTDTDDANKTNNKQKTSTRTPTLSNEKWAQTSSLLDVRPAKDHCQNYMEVSRMQC
ncbi:unnamed protein product [Pieris brassicae]|uniref:Uncharacterized protein n=1 Tax=Pieris brassicae TaxID=7116 RepID=A0A9P0TLH5_PIEBR|nr:unnamed protein product [Pieris brassicae]